jgi:SLT domain-containing protein
MYNQTQFEGVKIVEDYDNSYLISVLSLEKSKYKTQSAMFRVAIVKARRQASAYVNGATIASDLIVRTTEAKDSTGAVTVSEETVEKIRSSGFVQGMELLINFAPADDKRMVFIYMRKIE